MSEIYVNSMKFIDSIDFTLFTFRCHYIMVARYFFEITKRGTKPPILKDMGFLGSLNKKCKTKNIQHGMTNDHF